MKVKVSTLKQSDLDETEEIQLRKLLVFKHHPFATKVYVALKTGLPMSFVKKHWNKLEIGKDS